MANHSKAFKLVCECLYCEESISIPFEAPAGAMLATLKVRLQQIHWEPLTVGTIQQGYACPCTASVRHVHVQGKRITHHRKQERIDYAML